MVYIDSGADYTLIPKSVGSILGFIIEKEDKISEVKGIKENIPIIFKNIKLKIGEKTIETKVAWALIEEVPLLLGREGVFNYFNICFRKNKETIFIS